MIEREHDNLRAALGWSRDTGDHDTLLRLAGALAYFWYYRGYLNEGRHWLSQALETPADAHALGRVPGRSRSAGCWPTCAGETDRATALLTESFSWWEQSGDAYGHAIAGSLLGGVHVSQGQYDEAAALFAANETYFRDNEAFPRCADVKTCSATRASTSGMIAWAQGDDARCP